MSVETSPALDTTPRKPADTTAVWKRIRSCLVAAVAGLFAYAGYDYYFGPQPQAIRPDEGRAKPEPQNIDHVPTGTVIFDMQDASLEPALLRITRNKQTMTLRFLQGPKGKGLMLRINEQGYTVVNADVVGNRHSSHVSTIELWDDEMILTSRTRWYKHMRAHIHESEFWRMHTELQSGRRCVTITCTLHGLGSDPQIILVPLTFECE